MSAKHYRRVARLWLLATALLIMAEAGVVAAVAHSLWALAGVAPFGTALLVADYLNFADWESR